MKANMKDDLEDIPMAYFWYPVLGIVTAFLLSRSRPEMEET
jgi:hypothetical protein